MKQTYNRIIMKNGRTTMIKLKQWNCLDQPICIFIANSGS